MHEGLPQHDGTVIEELVERVRREGWSPEQPSDECRAQLARPKFFAPVALTELDVEGLHWHRNLIVLALRYLSGRPVGPVFGAQQDCLTRLALCHVIRERRDPGSFSLDTLTAELSRLIGWYEGRLHSSFETLYSAASIEDWRRAPHLYEPALSAAAYQWELLDVARDLRDFQAGAAMHHECTLCPTDAAIAEAADEVDANALGDLFTFLGGAGQLSYIDETGLRVSRKRIKAQYDRAGLFGEHRARVAKQRRAPFTELLVDRVPEGVDQSVLDAIEQGDDVDTLRAALESIRDESAPGSAVHFVASSLIDGSWQSIRAAERDSGLAFEGVRKAFQSICERIPKSE
jgi:hypothetical protein